MAETRTSFWRRNPWLRWVAAGLLLAVAAVAWLVSALLHRAEPFLRARLVEGLQQHFHARVELGSFHVSLMNGLWAEGKGLRIWAPTQVETASVPRATDAGTGEPLIQLEEFRFHAPLHYKPGEPVRISVLQLRGLDVDLPPRSHFAHDASVSQRISQTGNAQGPLSFKVDSIDCNQAHLRLETSKPGKLPLDFAIAHLKLTGVSADGAMKFDAELTNPRPTGKIHSKGTFGPWDVSDPGESPITGNYRFEHADLSDFKGIAGILSSTGRYEGTLRDLTVDGETDTPDFRLKSFDNPLPLHTQFHAIVDGTNGDTWLKPVDATLASSHFTAQGQIVRVPIVKPADQKNGSTPQRTGHDIALTVNVDRARIEDFLRLASHSATPLLTGAVTVKTTVHIPPGTAPVHERLRLNGSFSLDQARFTSAKIQDRIEELSVRGQGRPKDLKTTDPADIRSQMQGDFQMAAGVISLPALIYTVPGATIQVHGTYGVVGGALDFAGTAKTEATVSQMVGGWKGLLLKPADRFFKKEGAGTMVPIRVSGTREDPKFGIALKDMKSTSAQRPGERP